MSLADPKKVFAELNSNNQAIGAFNVINLETLRGVIQAAEQSEMPVIVQITPASLNWANYDYLVPMVLNAAKKSGAEIIVHLDHCQDLQMFERALKDGFNSAMFDGSHLPFEENVRMSLEAKKIAQKYGAFLELEIGKIGGKEDENVKSNVEIYGVDVVEKFYKLTTPDSLAVAFGTSHGVYKEKAKLDFLLLSNIKKKLKIPLVMHGTSGLSNNEISESIKNGINKVNIATELMHVYNLAVKQFFAENPSVLDMRKTNLAGINAIQTRVADYLKLFK